MSATEQPYRAANRPMSLANGSRDVRPEPRSHARSAPLVHFSPRTLSRAAAAAELIPARRRALLRPSASDLLRSGSYDMQPLKLDFPRAAAGTAAKELGSGGMVCKLPVKLNCFCLAIGAFVERLCRVRLERPGMLELRHLYTAIHTRPAYHPTNEIVSTLLISEIPRMINYIVWFDRVRKAVLAMSRNI